MNPDMPRKLMALQTFYRIHDELVTDSSLACSTGCFTCCTRNVTLSSLEAYYLMSHVGEAGRKDALARIQAENHRPHMVPSVTFNQMADICKDGGSVPDDDSDPSWGPCPLLDNGLCSVYEVRPLACRLMLSQSRCQNTGYAEMDEFQVTVGNVLIQYLEHIDAGSVMGNLSDLLPVFDDVRMRDLYWNTGRLSLEQGGMLQNRPLSVLMVPPEYRERIQPVLQEIQTV